MNSKDELEGYKGVARSKLAEWGVRVWSDVRVVNDAGSVFEGVILPRSETFDKQHVSIKLKNGYNIGFHVDRVKRIVTAIRKGERQAVEEDDYAGVRDACCKRICFLKALSCAFKGRYIAASRLAISDERLPELEGLAEAENASVVVRCLGKEKKGGLFGGLARGKK